MSFLKKLFGSTEEASIKAIPNSTPQPATAAEEVKVLDQYGRLCSMPRETWRSQVLLPNLALKRNDPNALYDLIVSGLRDGFAADVLDSARHLTSIDTERARGANLLGVVLLKLNNPGEARRVLERAVAECGEDSYLIGNLAKAYAGLGNVQQRDALLWRSMERDPNNENSLMWYVAIAKESGGPEAQKEAFERVAALPGSWRAQLWLARVALGANDLERATALYREVLSRVTPAPADALMQISGDLGRKGELPLLLELCAPRFEPAQHGVQVGNNLIKANLDLRRTEAAQRIVEQLYALKRVDWREILKDWERRIHEVTKHEGPVEGPLTLGLMSLDQPLWARGKLGFEALLPTKEGSSPRVVFICGSGEYAGMKETVQPRVGDTDDLGRVTRIFPLYLAEELYLGTSARAAVIIPVVDKVNLSLLGSPWDVESLVKSGIEGDAVVLLHVDARTTPWQLNFSVYRWDTRLLWSSWVVPLSTDQPAPALRDAWERVLGALQAAVRLRPAPTSSLSQWATPEHAAQYAMCLETALLMSLANSPDAEKPTIWGDRGLIDGLLHVAVSMPANVRARLLLLSSIEKEARRRPEVVREYLESLSALARQHPLVSGLPAELASAALERIRAAVSIN
jgi:tetratricopeptide (TPR) repeat protein